MFHNLENIQAHNEKTNKTHSELENVSWYVLQLRTKNGGISRFYSTDWPMTAIDSYVYKYRREASSSSKIQTNTSSLVQIFIVK